MTEALLTTHSGCILYDAAQLHDPSEAVFDEGFWQSKHALEPQLGGRGGVAFLRNGERVWVLRHYRRGGLLARLGADRYLWLGADRTRAFREWRLLAHLHQLGLPAPRPIAARYSRQLLIYRADLITERLPAVQPLSTLLHDSVPQQLWQSVGSCIATFHRHGVHHADLNAHNIMIDAEQRVYLLDFDRGRIRTRGAWEAAVLARLQRSLLKLRRTQGAHFEPAQWQALMRGYSVDIGG
jgi:3-deoxy-D-manno-octulosonic acid kinase